MTTIIDYGTGNIMSVTCALQRLGEEYILTDDPSTIAQARRVLLPGVGNAASAVEAIRAKGLETVIRGLRRPVLGICVGQQLMCRHSEEGDVDCVGIFDVDVKRFCPTRHDEKVPCMGWNDIRNTKTALFSGFDKPEFVYVVHSYYVPTCQWTIAESDYIQPYSAALHKDNFYATQFHPEKSGSVGERILKNFLNNNDIEKGL